jgi:hypothetical protein
VKQDETVLFRRGGDEQVRHLATTLAPRGQESLHLPSALNVLPGGLDQLEHRQVGHILVPLSGVWAPVANFEVGDPGSADLTRLGERVNHGAHGRLA